MTAIADQLQGTVRGAVETRDGIYETARQYVACLLDPEIVAWVTRDPDLPQFQPGAARARPRHAVPALQGRRRLGRGRHRRASPTPTMRAGVVAAERMGGRLDPPMTAVLDEAANVCRISDLPDLYSHFGSRGINVVTLLQSYRQGARVLGRGRHGRPVVRRHHQAHRRGPRRRRLRGAVSKLVGEHDVSTVSVARSEDGSSRSASYRRNCCPPDPIRALPKGTALLLATGIRPAADPAAPLVQGAGRGPDLGGGQGRSGGDHRAGCTGMVEGDPDEGGGRPGGVGLRGGVADRGWSATGP